MNNPPNNTLVSVIVPTYKRQKYLLITLKSILAQTHKRLEVLVVSDGDDDETKSVVDSLGDSRVKYLFTEHAGFPAVPRNAGLRQGQGELFAFCDDDDTWYPTKLEQQIPVFDDGRFAMCTTDYDFIDPDGDLLPLQTYYSDYHGELDWRTFFHSMGFICNAAGVFTREVYATIGGLNESPELKAHEDFEYWMRILKQQDGFFLDQKLVGYRVHPGSIQKVKPWGVLQRRLVLHRILKKELQIPIADYSKKTSKLWAHYFMDQFPFIKTVTRGIQGKSNSQ